MHINPALPRRPVFLFAKPGEKLVLRHRFVFHQGDGKAVHIAAAHIAAACERCAKEK